MEAMTYLEAHITPSGYPDWIAMDPNTMGEWTAESSTDYAAEAAGKAREAEGKNASPYKRWHAIHRLPLTPAP